MIDLILIIILLVLVLFLFVRKERFTEQQILFPATDCKFIARGRTKGKCLDYCRDPKLKQFYEGDKAGACSQENCTEICNGCKSLDLCHWINPYTVYNDSENEVKRTNELELISSFEDDKLILNWKWIDSKIHLSDLDNNYIIVFKEVNTNINNSSVLETNLKMYSFALENNNTAIPLLKKDTEYIFVVYSTNKVRRNGISNLINVKT